ncbi:MAG: choice-of-anchor J domain-containing protein [Bacteroidota bacterium]
MMRKLSIAILFILSTFTAVKAQQVIYSQTFEDTASLFQDYVLSNLDNGIPAGTGWDTLQTVPWFVGVTGPGANHAAIATSNYYPAMAADDWFVTPAIRIGKASKFSWKDFSLTSGNTDTYQVFVSTTEQSVSGCLFNDAAASYSCSNSTAFTSHTLDLAAAGYANQTIFIGLRLNTQSGGDKLAIDDLKVTEDSTHFVSLQFIVNMSNYIADSLFNPRTDTVDIAGSFNQFDGTKNILSLVPGSDSAIYATTIPGFIDGDRLEFKFRINSSWNDSSVEFPYGLPNRIWTIQHDQYTYTCFYNNQGSSSGIPENKLMDQVNVYPNPAHDFVLVEIPKGLKHMLLVNLNGKKLISQDIQSGKTLNLDLSSLSTGTYVLLFYTNQGYAGSKKLIKN